MGQRVKHVKKGGRKKKALGFSLADGRMPQSRKAFRRALRIAGASGKTIHGMSYHYYGERNHR